MTCELPRLETDTVFVTREVAAAPLAVSEQRDPKGLYRRARAGILHGMTGVDDPYEPPPAPDLVLDGTRPVREGAEKLEALLRERGLL